MYKKLTVTLMGLIISILSHAQTCNSNILRSTPDGRYELLNNGTEVKDTQTDLVWLRCSLGQVWSGAACTGSAVRYNWVNALQTAKNMGNGWRLPNVKELDSLVEQACYNPSINETFLLGTVSSSYWSSSPTSHFAGAAWVVYFDLGFNTYYGNGAGSYVRLVRSEQ